MRAVNETLRFLGFLRFFICFSILLNASLNAYLYWNAYKKFKMTWIIRSIVNLMVAIAISFFFYSLVALAFFLDGRSLRYQALVGFLAFVNIPLLFSLIDFKNASTSDLKKNDESYKLKKKK